MAKKSEDRVLAEKCIGPDGECLLSAVQERIIKRIIRTIRQVREDQDASWTRSMEDERRTGTLPPVEKPDTFLEDMGG
jgi:hypothetical protein